jgi:hypothetical protein
MFTVTTECNTLYNARKKKHCEIRVNQCEKRALTGRQDKGKLRTVASTPTVDF